MDEKKRTVVKIAGMDVPVHLAWTKIESLNTGADLLERLNDQYPDLATDFTRNVLPIVRERLKTSLADVASPPVKDDSVVQLAKELIKQMSPEEVIDRLQQEKDVDVSMTDLIYFISEKDYLDAMKREAIEFSQNQISPEQTAQLWNDLQRPAPGKMNWTPRDISELLNATT